MRILIQEGADPKVLGIFFRAVTQAVLLFGAETWVLTPRMERALSSFQHRVAQRITGLAGEETGRRELGIYLIGGGNGGNRLRGDRDIRHE